MAPTSSWQVDYGENTCKLARKFGREGEGVLLIIETMTPGDIFKITVLGSGVPSSTVSKLAYAVLPHGISREAKAKSTRSTDGAPGIILYRAPLTTDGQPRNGRGPASDLERAAQAETMTIGKLQLATGELAGPLKALQACVDDLLASHGLTPEESANFAVPIGDAGYWITSHDVRGSLFVPGANLTVLFKVDVGREGEPTGFTVIKASESKIFDRTVSKTMMKRARFHPILDGEGNPVPGVWVGSASFAAN